MKNSHILTGLFLFFLSFQFISCNNEPIGDDSLINPNPNDTLMQFRAKVNDREFLAFETTAIISEENTMLLTGKKESGEAITFKIYDVSPGTFNLSTSQSDRNVGIYSKRSSDSIPFTTSRSLGGEGVITLSNIDEENHTITGTFSFKGVRVKLDEDGEPILDDFGNPVTQRVTITDGVFVGIDYVIGEIDDDGGSGGTFPEDEFSVMVDGEEFEATSIEVSEPVVGGVDMIKIEARDADRRLIRLDIPKSLQVEQYDMVSISDGTMLIGIYKEPGEETLTSNPGTLTITEFDKVQGIFAATFRFTATDPLGDDPTVVEVTEGSVRIYFEGIPGAENHFSAKVDGADYEPEGVSVTRETINDYPRYVFNTVVGHRTMVLSFPQTISEGTYEMVDDTILGNEVSAAYWPLTGTSIPYYSESGTFTVTQFDRSQGTIEGTFSFTATDRAGQDPSVYEITQGEFFVILP